MHKHRSQKGPFHIIPYLSSSGDKFGKVCGYFKDGMCLKDNSKCMNDGYCNYYNSDKEIIKDIINVKTFYKLYTLSINEDSYNSIENFYISSEIKDIDATKISEDTLLAKELVNKKLGDTFKINETEYTIEKIQNIEE